MVGQGRLVRGMQLRFMFLFLLQCALVLSSITVEAFVCTIVFVLCVGVCRALCSFADRPTDDVRTDVYETVAVLGQCPLN